MDCPKSWGIRKMKKALDQSPPLAGLSEYYRVYLLNCLLLFFRALLLYSPSISCKHITIHRFIHSFDSGKGKFFIMTNITEPHGTTGTVSAPKSPTPYLLGGVGAMVLLIGCALILLVCSYWRKSNHYDPEGSNGSGLTGNSNTESGEKNVMVLKDSHFSEEMEEKFIVIMAGDDKPTYIATPTNAVEAQAVTV